MYINRFPIETDKEVQAKRDVAVER